MKLAQRKTAPGVRNGRVQRKNNWSRTPHYLTSAVSPLVVDRTKAVAGTRHVVRQEDVWKFIDILPGWEELSRGLNAILIDGNRDDCMGWCERGVVAICAWETELEWGNCCDVFFWDHVEVFDKLAIPYEKNRLTGGWIVQFDESSAKAFLLVHVLVHELGHHHDRMTTRSKREASRGEQYAESYAREHEDEIIRLYQKAFRY